MHLFAPGIKPFYRLLLLSVSERGKKAEQREFQTASVVSCNSCALQNLSLRFNIKHKFPKLLITNDSYCVAVEHKLDIPLNKLFECLGTMFFNFIFRGSLLNAR